MKNTKERIEQKEQQDLIHITEKIKKEGEKSKLMYIRKYRKNWNNQKKTKGTKRLGRV